MPNDKVRYLKDYDKIREKIVYVKDKDLLGFDSASSPSFQFNLWRMKYFGMSENFILMDDDCFIGKPLKKSDFFYEENGKIFPAIISPYYSYRNYTAIMNFAEKFDIDLNDYSEENHAASHTYFGFMYSLSNTHKFIYELLGKSLVIPDFTHNAIPINLNDLYEIYTMIKNNYIYANETLFAKYRSIKSLQCQVFVQTYTFNKYKRKVNKIPYQYIDMSNVLDNNYNYSLFCINTGGNLEYSRLNFIQGKTIMEKQFPIPTKYEIYNYTLMTDLCFEVLADSKIKQKEYFGLKIKSFISLGINFIELCIIIFIISYYKKKINKYVPPKPFLRVSDNPKIPNDINIELKLK